MPLRIGIRGQQIVYDVSKDNGPIGNRPGRLDLSRKVGKDTENASKLANEGRITRSRIDGQGVTDTELVGCPNSGAEKKLVQRRLPGE